MAKKRAVIVGAGIAGLSAGCYLQMNGYNTEIYEAHHTSGGLCTSWARNGYLIEGCLHGLLGSSPAHPLYKMWNELIDMEQIHFIDEDMKHLFLFDDGRSFVQYARLETLQKYMIEIAPEDKGTILDFIGDIKKFQSAQLSYDKPKEFIDLPGKLKMLKALPIFPVIKKWLNVSSEEFSKRFRNNLLQSVVKQFSSPVLFEMFVLSEMDLQRCGYPAIGSQKFTKLFENKYIRSGGEIFFNSRVKKVNTKDHVATGIELVNGEEKYADLFVFAMDGRTVIFDFLDGKYLNKSIGNEYDKAEINASRIQISLGVNKNIVEWPRSVKVVLSTPYRVCDGSSYSSFDCQVYHEANDPDSSNKTLFVIQLETKNGEFWADLRNKDKRQYTFEKAKMAEELISIINEKIEGFKDSIDMIDVATPATYIRYTGNWRGSIQGWSSDNIFKPNPFKKQLPGLDNLYMIGQWVEPGGGVPNSFRSGRDLAQIICRRDRKRFVSS